MLKPSAQRPRAGSSLARGLTLVALGLGMIGFWGWSIGHFASDSERLREAGASTPGRVEKLRPDSRASSGAAKVSYRVDGHVYEEDVDLGSDVDGYREGQSVVVHYDRQKPSHMTIDDADNQPIDLVWLQVCAGLGGLACIVGGVVTVVGRDRSKVQGPRARARGDFH